MTLEVHDLTITLARGAIVVEGVSILDPAGRTLGIVGESGAGKSAYLDVDPEACCQRERRYAAAFA